MPKIGKEKFDELGQCKGRTMAKTKYEFELHYHTIENYFYFEREAIEKAIPSAVGCVGDFRECDTRGKAISKVSLLISERIPQKKMLGINISVGSRAITRYKEITEPTIQEKDSPLLDFVGISKDENEYYRNYSIHELTLEIARFIVYSVSPVKDDEMFVTVPNTWIVPTKKDVRFRSQLKKYVFIEWTPEREARIASLCSNLDNLGATLLSFLAKGMFENGGDFAQFIDNGAQLALPTTTLS